MTSKYEVVLNQKDSSKYALTIEFDKQRLSGVGVASRNMFYQVSVHAFNENKQFKQAVVFSYKNPPRIEIIKNNTKTLFPFPKKSQIIEDWYMGYQLDKGIRETINASDKVTIVLPMSDNSEKQFELPPEILAEWKQVLNADLRSEKANM